MDSKELFECEMSVRLRRILSAADLNTFKDVVSLGKANLLKYRNFGHKSLLELEAILEENGHKFN